MTITYRVLVIRQDAPRRANLLGSAMVEPAPEVLFEAAGPDAGRLLAYAPDEVAAALATAGSMAAVDAIDAANRAGSFAPPVAEEPDAPAVNPPGHFRPADAPAAPAKRKRRTRAEIEADRARETAGGNAFGEQVVADTEAQQAPAATEQAPAAEPQQPVDEPAPQQQPEPAPAPVAATTPAAPYNPFA